MDGIGETEETGWYLVLLATGNELNKVCFICLGIKISNKKFADSSRRTFENYRKPERISYRPTDRLFLYAV